MYIEHLIIRHRTAYSIGKKIIFNMNHKNNFFNTPPIEYNKYAQYQEELLQNFFSESTQLNNYWIKNKQYMKFYLLK